jgi:hypothetical protein
MNDKGPQEPDFQRGYKFFVAWHWCLSVGFWGKGVRGFLDDFLDDFFVSFSLEGLGTDGSRGMDMCHVNVEDRNVMKRDWANGFCIDQVRVCICMYVCMCVCV